MVIFSKITNSPNKNLAKVSHYTVYTVSACVHVGVWWWLQDEEFRNQDPRFIIVSMPIMF